MATQSEIELELIKPLRPLFRTKRDLDEPETIQAWARFLKRYSVQDIRGAAEHLATNPPGRDFPAIDDVHKAIRASRPAEISQPIRNISISEAEVCAHPMAPQWAREASIHGVAMYCAAHGRWPDDEVIDGFKNAWRPFLEELAKIFGSEDYIAKPLLMDTAEMMLSRHALMARNAGVVDGPAERALIRFTERRRSA